MKLVYKDESRALVYSVKNILALNSIESHIKNEYGHTSGGELGLSNSLLELWLLNDQDYDTARSIIETQVVNPVLMEPWTCANCGEENDGAFQLCWSCQNEHVDA